MAGIHRLEQVEGFGPSHLADDDPLGAHAQAVAHQIAHGDRAFALQIGRPRFEAHHMRLLQLQLRRVLAGDDALIRRDVAGQAVEQGGLARAGAAGDQDVAAAMADDRKQRLGLRRQRAESDELVERQPLAPEFADGERRAVEGEGRKDDIDAAAIGKPCIADRRRFIHPPADPAGDALADIGELAVIGETDRRGAHPAVDLDIALARTIDHDVGDAVLSEERLQGSEAQNVVADVFEKLLALGAGHNRRAKGEDFAGQLADFLAGVRYGELGQFAEIDAVDQRLESRCLDLVIALRPQSIAACGEGRALVYDGSGGKRGQGGGIRRGFRQDRAAWLARLSDIALAEHGGLRRCAGGSAGRSAV